MTKNIHVLFHLVENSVHHQIAPNPYDYYRLILLAGAIAKIRSNFFDGGLMVSLASR